MRELFEYKENLLIVEYENLCDTNRIFEKGEEKFAQEAELQLKKLCKEIRKAFSENKHVVMNTSVFKTADEYEKWLNDTSFLCRFKKLAKT